MKLAKLSLAAIVVAGLASSSFAADTLADAFKNGKVSGELRAYYFDRDKGPGKDADIFNVGVVLGYVTDSFYGFKLGATFQSNYAPFADGAIGETGTGKDLFKGDMYGSGAVLSEMYVQYAIGKTTAKVGRQFISTPLVAGSGSRMIKQSFQGATIINTDLPQTTLVAGYVDKFQARTDGAGDVADFEKVGDNGAYTLLAINKSIAGLTITGQWAEVTDAADIYYGELAYAGKAGEFAYGLSGQYDIINYDTLIGRDDSGFYGLKASFGFSGLKTYVAYSKVDKDDRADGTSGNAGLGGGSDILYTANVITGGDYSADAKAYAIDANYAITSQAKIGARYVSVDLPKASGAASKDYSTINFYTSYAFDGSLKGFVVEAQYEDLSADSGATDTNEFRFKAAYKF
ncbi:OprD family outer membrane porin [Sulfurospirillum multivorans]|uniref:Outer membrane porin n=2 Tax=Sulfurospirillum multivorans TaxID=66821 RepID=A0AA86AJN5_SULMK|nr:OprD family outer membrane porin [Sulfurospirillum multivorans]AHJ11769.1 outer membrane porin [Sulfurospirillum multivorans DSM 12446]QEH05275.1 outer membrane porin [Sulfurospirillum multivorans]